MIRVLLLLVTVAIFSFSSVIEFKEIDPKKSIVQIGTYSKEKTVKRIQKELETKQDIYIRKEKNFTVIYVVNLVKKDKKKILQQIRKKHKDAFIQKKAYGAIKKSFVKKQKKPSKIVKKKEIPSKVKSPLKTINKDTVAIQIGTYSKEKTVKRIQKELSKREIYIKKIKNYTIIYVINIPKNEKQKVLKDLRKKYKDAFISKKAFSKKKKTLPKKSVTEIPTIELLEKLYKEGLDNFNQKNYAKSYQLFKQIFTVDMKNMDVNFYLARSAYEIGKYKEALDIYDYMLFRDPHNNQIKLEVGKTYNKLKKYDKAKIYFAESYK